jgi:hypothetical protein
MIYTFKMMFSSRKKKSLLYIPQTIETFQHRMLSNMRVNNNKRHFQYHHVSGNPVIVNRIDNEKRE